jgi:hypothetical protein
VRRIELKVVLEEMGREATQPAANAVANRLYLDNCLARPILTIGWCTVWPSYIGVVVATQRDISEQEQVVRQLAADWETTSVDVKELLQLDTDRQKAEFCKDLLGLANTRVSGQRFVLLGFNDKSRQFTTSVDPSVDAHRMESVLSAYCAPVPEINYSTVALAEGNAGMIQVASDPAKLPYRLARDVWKLKAGSVFVRHNTLVAIAEGEELDYLISEGKAARGEP